MKTPRTAFDRWDDTGTFNNVAMAVGTVLALTIVAVSCALWFLGYALSGYGS